MVLAIDIGTTFLKTAVVDSKGNLLFNKKVKLDITTDNNTFEVDPNQWVEGLTELCFALDDDTAQKISSVVISGNGPTIVPVGEKDSVADAVLWMDKRSEDLVSEISEKLNEFIPPNFFLSKAYYIMKRRPDLYKKVKYFFSCPEYISYVLTKHIFTTLPGDGFLPFYWDDNKLDLLGMDASKFPPFKSVYEAYGVYKGGRILGNIPEGVPVICGGPDFLMSVLGAGAVEDGILCDRTGTSEGLNYCTRERLVVDGLRTLPHIKRDLFTVAGLIPDSGNLVLNNNIDKLLFKYRSILNKMSLGGFKISEVRIIGGHSEIYELNKKKAEMFDVPVKVYPIGSELIGNAVLGFVVTGEYDTISDACANMVREVVCFNV